MKTFAFESGDLLGVSRGSTMGTAFKKLLDEQNPKKLGVIVQVLEEHKEPGYIATETLLKSIKRWRA